MIDVAIIGAGLAGLSCAVHLEKAGLSVLLLEAQDAPGGRVRTDMVDGFRLDRGFQILLTEYPETERLLDYKSLRLRSFSRGALVRQGGRFHHFADPFRDSMGAALSLLFDPVVTLRDKLHVAKLRTHVHRGSIPDLFAKPEITTREYLANFGFSTLMIERFFEPFLGGVFLEKELATSSRYFEFLFRMFAYGDTAVPEAGMEMIPRQLAVRLHTDTLLTNTTVTGLRHARNGFTVETDKEGPLGAHVVVVAVDELQALTLLRSLGVRTELAHELHHWNQTTTFYYAASEAPVDGALLVLNGDGSSAGPVNNVAVMSSVSERYAPADRHLIAASVVGQAPETAAGMEKLERAARTQLARWFGREVGQWVVVGGYPITQALPLCRNAEWEVSATSVAKGIFVCGDYRETPSIQGALASGRRVAHAILRQPG